jgi:hypothetical protein
MINNFIFQKVFLSFILMYNLTITFLYFAFITNCPTQNILFILSLSKFSNNIKSKSILAHIYTHI